VRSRVVVCVAGLAAAVSAVGCSPDGGADTPPSTISGGGGIGGSGTGGPPSDRGGGDGIFNGNGESAANSAPAPPGCGDGTLTEDEACDDGNRDAGDGCAANCLSVQPGFSCSPAGAPCHPIARCGDGVLGSSEPCDDGNAADGDGCSSACKLEIGFKCEGAPSRCSATTCGDGVREGAEACDDGNALPFDGCSSLCQAEPDCGPAGCTSRCGDGLVIHEACDDGNERDGDGCSSACEMERGFRCTAAGPCDPSSGRCRLRVPVIYRDFDEAHPDFEVGCGEHVAGIVQGTLGEDGAPVLANGNGACIESAATFAEWYGASAESRTVVGELVLFENGKGGFVNRYGPDGEQWTGPMKYSNVQWGGPGGTGCGQCTPSATGRCYDPCLPYGPNDRQACCAEESQEVFDGSPLFFPVDGAASDPGSLRRAKIPAEYGYDGWPEEHTVFPGAPLHNFHFTTEVVYWFAYERGRTPTLDFTGDDDVWVFVNGKLALDLGGPHVPMSGTVTLDAQTAARLGLLEGAVHEIRVFHAERKVAGSSFRLTLAGFDSAGSDCTPICGDGVVTLGEECDAGINDGGYGECEPGCVLGPHCGDGIVQAEEDCDDGNRFDGDLCGSACRDIVVR
jgi:fibro-slime domain-containing protein